ncbi:hypothetical protein ABAC460_17890 [Asticcacaulis sp. AC460]|uniref:hypothetical protein n=1 Tax=Asticcacaulis sp. AC460 TaxID=1282360 RepID=UPI0003C3E6F7|nr:hypothetical protein [Asticcacaulis sp. AC460]ESQ88064.1 hypothetical protein ABAC460_17890 [Asticcacaulis sp. AC460]
MTVIVDIADRLYDYTDEEKAADAVASFQTDMNIGDEAVLAIWQDESDPRRSELERRIFDAVDLNGSTKRARESVPGGVSLVMADE